MCLYLIQTDVTPLKSSECNFHIICATPHNILTIHKVSASVDLNFRGSYPETNMLKNLSNRSIKKSLDRNLEIICAGPPHGLTIYQVSLQSDVNCRRSYSETKEFTGGRTDANGYNNCF